MALPITTRSLEQCDEDDDDRVENDNIPDTNFCTDTEEQLLIGDDEYSNTETDTWSHSSTLAIQAMDWWQRHPNPAWPEGERITSDRLLLSLEPTYEGELAFDATDCFVLCCPFLSVVHIIRLMKTCYFLHEQVPPASQLSTISFQRLSNTKLPNTPQKLRAEVFRSRVREKDWGKMAPKRLPPDHFHLPEYVFQTVARVVSKFRDLKEVNLNSVCINDSSLDFVATLPQLIKLNLDRTQVSNLSALSRCERLQTLTLRRSPVKDISPLISCTALVKLDLAYSPLTRINALDHCRSLRHLDLAHSTISDIQGIESLTKLVYLDLTCTPVMDIFPIGGCVKLQHLSLASTNVIALSPLRHCHVLKYLNLKQAPVKYLDALLHCPALSRLILADTQVENVNPIRKCFLLCYLDLSRTNCDDSEVVSTLLIACPLLEMLIGVKGRDVIPLLKTKEVAYRKHALGTFLRAASVIRHVQRRFRDKLTVRRREEAKAFEEATILARAVGKVDAFGNVIVDEE
jgi:Leucine-rich repeat (LRR) protein